MRNIIGYELFESNDPMKVELKVITNTLTAYKADVVVDGIIVGNVRRNVETIRLDLNKVGKTRQRVYHTVSWDQSAAKDKFGYPVNNMSRTDEKKFNSAEYRTPPTVAAIKKYILAELDRLDKAGVAKIETNDK